MLSSAPVGTGERRRPRGAIILSLVLAGIGGAAVIGSWRYGLVDDGRIGPGAMPAFLGGCLLFLSLLDAARNWRAEGPIGHVEGTGGSAAKAFSVLGILAVAVALAPLIGLMLAMAVMIFVVATFVERLSLSTSAALSAVSFGLFYLIFELLLGVPMPGPW